jgi:hypothetical protein
MNANEIFNDVRSEVFDLLETGEMEVVFGDNIGDKFIAYLKSENEIEVEYNGNTCSIECNNLNNTEYVARLIMHCFAKLYLRK